jgi:hypothetical protein
MGRRANILCCIVEDEVFEMHKFTIDPQRGAGIGELVAFDPSLTDRRTGDPLVEACQRDSGVEGRPHEGSHANFCEIISH